MESSVTQAEAQHHDDDNERNPQARGKNPADADEIFPEERRGRRAGSRQIEPRAPGLLIFLCALPVASRTAAMRVASFCEASTKASSNATSE